ncbi:hypothetical protein [Primorskyibacter flagellatus]|uniref:hypothetical protein n=1 Tax=Primorskyibacter flagellatus TaxID=1387277 RepID=UPI0015C4C5A0|nr:hypothetical protein [Primorskyibacter flagellatus]
MRWILPRSKPPGGVAFVRLRAVGWVRLRYTCCFFGGAEADHLLFGCPETPGKKPERFNETAASA